MDTVNLGDKVKDRITGLEGIAIGITTWLYGCRRVTIQPQEAKDGRMGARSTGLPVEQVLVDSLERISLAVERASFSLRRRAREEPSPIEGAAVAVDPPLQFPPGINEP